MKKYTTYFIFTCSFPRHLVCYLLFDLFQRQIWHSIAFDIFYILKYSMLKGEHLPELILQHMGSEGLVLIFFENYNLTPLEMYNGLSQIYRIKPEGRIH